MNHHENPRLKKPKVDDLTQRIHKRHTSYRVAPINNFAPIRPDRLYHDDQEIKRPSLNKKLSNMSLNKDLPKEDKLPGQLVKNNKASTISLIKKFDKKQNS